MAQTVQALARCLRFNSSGMTAPEALLLAEQLVLDGVEFKTQAAMDNWSAR